MFGTCTGATASMTGRLWKRSCGPRKRQIPRRIQDDWLPVRHGIILTRRVFLESRRNNEEVSWRIGCIAVGGFGLGANHDRTRRNSPESQTGHDNIYLQQQG